MTERAVRRQSREGRAHLDTHEALLLCRKVQVLLNRSPSWRQGSRPQPVNQAQDLSEQRFGDSDFCELECDGTAMSHDLGTDLDELVAQRGQGSVLDLLR